MKEDHELIDDEELKEFFLTEAKLLCPSVEKEESVRNYKFCTTRSKKS